MRPDEIEGRSFRIIDAEAGPHDFTPRQWTLVRRMIHTSADFEFKMTVRFHPQAVSAGVAAIQNGKPIITDTRMAEVGIRQPPLAAWGSAVKCYITDTAVAAEADRAGTTRARAAVDKAADEMTGGIYVIGNAPTALLRLIELVEAGRARPALIVGLPVGFVNAAESKARLMTLDTPHISNVGRKGGSTLAAAVVNGLVQLAMAVQDPQRSAGERSKGG